MKDKEIELTILMPCLNEEETMAVCIDKAKMFLQKNDISGEVLIADNGSTDNSVCIAEEKGARVIHVERKGYGSALIAGCDAAYGRYVIMGDSDDSYDFLNLMPFLEKLREGYDLVMGNRFKGGIKKNAMPFLHRYLGNPVLSTLGRLLYHSKIGDFHCGLRGYNKERIQALNLKTPGMEYASEMVVKAEINGYKITEVPTTLSPDGRSRPPHLRSFTDGWRHLRFLMAYSPRWLFLYPGLLLTIIGLAGMTILSFGEIQIGKIYLGIHTMLYMSGFLIAGVQVLMFMLLADIYASKYEYIKLTDKKRKFIQKIKMEKCMIAGGLLIFAGIVLTIIAFSKWAYTGYGNLIPESMMRLTIPSWTMLILGIQIIANSFFMGILRE